MTIEYRTRAAILTTQFFGADKRKQKQKQKNYLFLLCIFTLKNSIVEPVAIVPYCTSRCDTKSSTELIGVAIRSIVNSAAKLAVYDETRMNVKNHQTALTMRPDIECGDM